MMKHYLETKEQYPDCLLFYRLGDFYEMFFDDAKTVSKELDLVLTGKECGLTERAPMCGVPFHAADSYINRLVEKGYKVAIAEQMEDPRQAKGLVKREVIRVVTPGTVMDSESLLADTNNYIACIAYTGETYGMAVCDITTGVFMVTQTDSARQVEDEIDKYAPAELVCNKLLFISELPIGKYSESSHILVSELPDSAMDSATGAKLLSRNFGEDYITRYSLGLYPGGVSAAGALMWYLDSTQKTTLGHINEITVYKPGSFMLLDSYTRKNLELTHTLRDKEKKGSLAFVLDRTKTAMGGRLLRQSIEQPLIDEKEINSRLDAVDYFFENMAQREEIREYLNPVRDLERLLARISYGSINPRELLSFASSLEMIPHIKALLRDVDVPLIRFVYSEMDDLADITKLIGDGISEDAPISVHEGGIIKTGYNEEVNTLRKAKTDGKNWLAALEAEERERTGIKNLRIKYSRVFGYCFEVTNSSKDMVPEDYIRRQTLVNAERYTMPRLKELEDTILGAEEKLFALEYRLFSDIRQIVSENVIRIKKTASAVAMLDMLASFADVAVRNGYTKPNITSDGIINIKNGRHPVVEYMLGRGRFVENDTLLDTGENLISIITGPNMAGKSTYMRQTALIVLMAQIGSFVPAEKAEICICDRIFTRVGASDDLASGMSTFMVEMSEVASILKNATKKSLIILDEIGRGTSTFDGLAIAWSVIEYIADRSIIGAKTLFATHYHELTELEGCIDGVKNYCIAVKEQGDDIVFLRKIVRGGADKSYGVQVAKLAGVPEAVLRRAKELISELSDADITVRAGQIARGEGRSCEPSVAPSPAPKSDDIESRLLALNPSELTPIEALNFIYEWQEELKRKQGN